MADEEIRTEIQKPLFLERKRVNALLAEALKSRIVTVIAGEGSGKTHAVNSFLQKNSRRAVWLQLSERDNIPWHFWENFEGEIRRLSPRAGMIMREIGFPETPHQRERHAALIKSGIVSDEPFIFVMDDLHLLTNPVILSYIEHNFSLPIFRNPNVLISRSESGAGLNTLNFLSKGLLSTITIDDLLFTEEETAEYFSLNRIFLGQEEINRIWCETEGWAMALGLILREIQTGQGIPAQSAGSRFSPVRNWDQVMFSLRKMESRIFSAMSPKLQKFLIKLSLIEHWPLVLLEQLDDGKNIKAMEQFSSVVRFDRYLYGFRMHHLFVEFLKEKQNILSQEEIKEVYGKDAQWCLDNNLLTDAAEDYEKAEDYAGITRLIESLLRMLPKMGAAFFLETVDRLCAKSCIGDDTKDICVQNKNSPDNLDRLYLNLVARPRLLMILNRFDEAFKECNKALACFESGIPESVRARFLGATYTNMGTLGILSCKFTRDYTFDRWFQKGYYYYLENPKFIDSNINQINIGFYVILVGLSVDAGEIDAFIDCYARAARYASLSMNGYLFGIDTLARAEFAFFRGDLNTAEKFARQAAFEGREKKQYEVENRALFYLMRLSIHTNNIADIGDIQRRMEAQLDIDDYFNRHMIHDIILGRFYSKIGMVEKIAPWLRITSQTEAEAGLAEYEKSNILFSGFDALVNARCLFMEKKYQAALQMLEEEKGGLGNFLLGSLEIKTLKAITRFKIGDRDGAFATLSQAYKTADSNGLDMPFIEQGENMCALINALFKSDNGEKPECPEINRDWLRVIRERASAYSKKVALVVAQYSDPGASVDNKKTINPYESAILQLLSTGCTEKEIAAEMNISINMLKSAIRSLYNALGVTNRASAIRIAITKNLIN
ncbi:MAG: LuxR C-terminal-related transcriptional regulator [Treponema sp.]|jgi:LuxR family maltose regulon positive regulatory protein|nr:LuxR C-terminal-related transcriptional regulator [Treponema sp.]